MELPCQPGCLIFAQRGKGRQSTPTPFIISFIDFLFFFCLGGQRGLLRLYGTTLCSESIFVAFQNKLGAIWHRQPLHQDGKCSKTHLEKKKKVTKKRNNSPKMIYDSAQELHVMIRLVKVSSKADARRRWRPIAPHSAFQPDGHFKSYDSIPLLSLNARNLLSRPKHAAVDVCGPSVTAQCCRAIQREASPGGHINN